MTKTRIPTRKGMASEKRQALQICAEVLRHASEERLPRPLERKILKMIEAKESLTDAEHEQLVTLVDLALEQSLQKIKAQVALELPHKAYPELKGKFWRASAGGSMKK